MKITKRILLVSILSIFILFSLVGCSSGVPQETYDSLQSELADSQAQLAAMQDNLNQATVQYQDAKTQYEDLKKQYDATVAELQNIEAQLDALERQGDTALAAEIKTLQTAYDKLEQEYDALKSQYDALTQKAVFTAADIDQAIFKLINEERENAGVSKLSWGKNLYTWGLQNSRYMAENWEYRNPAGAWNEIFWAAGYSNVDDIAKAALLTWKTNDYRFRYNIINGQSIFGAVATYKSGDIYYITFMADIYG